MIFKTITSSVDSSRKSLALFNKDFNTFKTDIKSGYQFGGFLGGVKGLFKSSPNTAMSQNDIDIIKQYNKAVADGTLTQKNFDKITQDATISTKSYLSGLNGQKAALNSSKIATIGLTIAQTALNAAITMGIGALISYAVSGLMKMANAAKEAKEATSDFNSQVNSFNNEYSTNSEKIGDLETRYKKLSQGVSEFGENISLSKDEYSEYKSIVADISEIMPNLNGQYNEMGEQIGFATGKLKDLNKEYRTYRQNEAIKFITGKNEDGDSNVQSVFDNFKNQKMATGWSVFGYGLLEGASFGFANQGQNIYGNQQIANSLKYLQNSSKEDALYILESYADNGGFVNMDSDEMRDVFGTTTDELKEMTDEQFNVWQKNLHSYITTYQNEIDNAALGMRNVVSQMAIANEDYYGKLNEEQRNSLSLFVNNLSYDFFDSDKFLDENGNVVQSKVQLFVDNIINKIATNENGFADALNNLFKVNIETEDLPATEWVTKINELVNQVADELGLVGDEKDSFVKSLKIKLGFELDKDGNEVDVTTMTNAIKKAVPDAKEGDLDFNYSDLKIAYDIIQDLGTDGSISISELTKKIQEYNDKLKDSNEMTVSLSATSDKIKEMNSFLKELNDGGLSNDSIEKIISDYSELIGYIGDEAKLRTELKKKIAEEENKYKQALRNKVMASSSFTELVVSKNETLFEELGLAYDKDTQKFVSEQREKALAAETYAHQAGNAWAQLYADQQVLTAPDYDASLHNAGKNSKYRDENGNWHFEAFEGGELVIWTYEAGSSMAKILDSQRELSNISNFDIDFGDDDKSSSDKNEALDNYLKDAENRYKIHQDETKYIQELQWAHDNLTKDEKERIDIIGKINEAYRDLADNRIKDLEHQIDLKKELYGEDYDATAELTEIQNIAHEEADRYREFARKRLGYYDEDTTDEQKAEIDAIIEKTDEIQSNQKTWWDAENKKLDFYSKQYENRVRDIEHARDMALSKDENANVTSFYKQLQSEYHKEAERLRLLDPEKYKEEIQELERLWWDAQNEMLDYNKQVVDDFLNKLQTKLDDSYDIRISRLNSQSSLLSTHFDLVNAIEEEQHNLNKELLEAETIGAKMNEQEKESLFTKAEHARLSGKLNDIMLDISDLQNDYMRDLETATSDTIDEITNHYERQYELKMKEYEIVKAELSLTKAQQVLENTENEKSVRTWNGSSWVYEANLQDVIKAQEDVENAKYELARAQDEEAQQVALNDIDSRADALETEKNKLATAIDEMAEKMEGSGKDITDMLQTIADTDLPTFDAIIQSMGDSIKTALNISDDDIDSIRRSSGGVAITSDAIAYATGTKNAKKGAGLFDEDGFGSEVILTNGGILTQFNGGERVFSPEMADRLWEMAQQNYTFTPMIAQPDTGKLIPIEDKINNAINNISNAFGDTYMVNGVQLSESEGGTLKGFMDFLKKKI